MPDVIGIRVKCPECGATTQASGDTVKCSYCGTESRVQRRTQVLQRPILLPPLQRQQPQRIAIQTRSQTWPLVATVAIALFSIGIAQFASYFTSRATRSSAPATREAATRRAPIVNSEWETARPLLVDLDMDETEDAIGIVRYTGETDEMHLRAVSGRTGKTLWETPSLGTYIDTYRSRLALVEGHVVFGMVDGRPRVEAYDAKTGKQEWAIAPPEVLEALCRDRDRFVEMITKDKLAFSVHLGSGTVTPISPNAKKSKCVRVTSTEPPPSDDRFWNLEIPGMQRDTVVGEGSSLIVYGYKSPGTSIPMIAVMDDHRHVKWKTELPSKDPMATKRLSFQRPAYDETMIVSAYGYTDDKRAPVIVAFDRATGARLFETSLQVGDPVFLREPNLNLGRTTVWVALGQLRAYDRKTGALRWSL